MTGDDIAATETVSTELIMDEGDAGSRIDVALARKLPDLSRARVQALLREGHIRHKDGRTIESHSLRVKPGDAFAVHIPPAAPAEPEAENIPLVVLHEDKYLIVIDKPKGLVVHPAPGHATGTLVNALIQHCGDSLSGIGGVRRPGIVHRLDKDTTGIMVVAKTDAAHQGLAEQFASHGADGRLERGYLAIVWGVPEPGSGRIDAAIGRRTHNRTKMAVVHNESGRHAATKYDVVTRMQPKGLPATSLVRCRLETGRTHQVRVHMAHAGHPLLGDPTYGTGFASSGRKLGPEAQVAVARLGRQALHAALLAFEHPVTGKAMRFESPLPADLAYLLTCLKAGT